MQQVHEGQQASLDLTHVLYDDSSFLSLALALITLSPILLMASYAALAVQTREFLIIVMWAGQLASEAINWLVKRLVKQERPLDSVGNGYGFPSSHSQYMAYFASFLLCHLFFRHRFTSSGSRLLDQVFRLAIYCGLLGWAGAVAYSRYSLGYHSPHQIIWGLIIGSVFGVSLYLTTELIPRRRPGSLLGRFKRFILSNNIATWLRIRDGWDVWSDGGREPEWLLWKSAWERSNATKKD